VTTEDNVFKRIREDIRTVFARDPAARTAVEVVLCYPGLHAIWLHRISHWLWTRRLRLLARFLSHAGRFFTGIEIHPGARIGRRFFIDHGMGVVIGETAEIGDDVFLYQGVVLGGTSLEKKKRHPTIENHVVIGAGATLLGAIAIGAHSRVGAGSVVIDSVPPHSTVVGVPGRIVKSNGKAIDELEHARLPDPVADIVRNILKEQEWLHKRVGMLEDHAGLCPIVEYKRPAGNSAEYFYIREGI